MAEHLTDQQHRELTDALESGNATLLFTRTFARQFFLRVNVKSISNETGQSTLVQKLSMNAMLAASMLLLIASMALIIQAFGWAGLLIIAVLGIFWTILAGFTTELGTNIHSIVLLVLTLIAAYFLPAGYGPPALCFGLSVLLFRSAHILAAFFLYRLISQSCVAYNQLYEHFSVERH